MKKFYYLFLTLALLSACHKKTVNQPLSIPVSAMKVVVQTIPVDYEYVGVAESSHIIELRARVEGYLEKISYQEGTLVQQNDLLFTLDQRPFIDTLKEKEGDLARQNALYWDAQQSKNRMVPLYQQKAVSQRDYDNAIARDLSAMADVMVAEAAVQKAQLNLSYTEITAPVKGMVGRAIYREGALIAPGQQSSLLAYLYVIDPIWVNFSVSEGDILQARQEMCKKQLVLPTQENFKIEVVLADGTTMPADGKINFTAPSLQQDTGTMFVRSTLINPNAWLKPGQFVKVIVKGAYRPHAVIVPQSSVVMGQNGTFVYVVSEEGKAIMRPVTLGDWYLDYWVVNSGLQEGDVVIASGVNRVQNNTPVTVQAWAPSTPNPPVAPKQCEGQ